MSDAAAWRVFVWVGLLAAGAQAARAGEVRFQKTVVDAAFRSEGVALGDVNRDGKTDLIVGVAWYEAPRWRMHEIQPTRKYDPAKDRSPCYISFAADVNADGWVDSIVIGRPGAECFWFENPKGKPGHWARRVVCKSACNETPQFADLLGTGGPVLLFGTGGRMTWFAAPKDPTGPWQAHPVGPKGGAGTAKYAHGLGVGDMNGDGRKDVITTAGWYEAPKDRGAGTWPFRRAKLGPAAADMYAYDVDGDGDADVVSSSAHAYGIWWFERIASPKGTEFKQHLICKDFSQTHALHLVDVNGDGLKDLVTGKRYFAHRGKDPGAHEPAVLYWFELRRDPKAAPRFVPHRIDENSGVGTQFAVGDVDADGRVDVVTSNKKGVHLFRQRPAARP